MKHLTHLLAIVALLVTPLALRAQSGCTDYTSVPYTTGFEGLSTGQLPACWQQIQTGTSGAGTFPSAYAWSNARNGSVYFELESSSGQTEIVALPLMQNISGLKLTFWASLMNHNFVLEVGVMEGTTFVPVDTVSNLIVGSGGNWHGSYHEYTVYFANYYGSGEQMAMRVTASSSYTLMIDDLTVSEDNGCYPLSNLTASDIDSESVTLSWVDDMNVGATYTVTYWKDGGDTTEVSYVTDTFYTAAGLDANSTYHFMVMPNCTTGDGVPVTGDFLTACGSTPVPYYEGFESYASGYPPTCWTVLAGEPRASTSYVHSGSRSLYFYGASSGGTNTIALPPFNMSLADVQLHFWTRPSGTSSGTFQVGYMTDVTDITTFVSVATYNASDIGTTYTEKTVQFPGAPSGARIVLRHTPPGYNSWYVDDLSVSVFTGCYNVSNVVATNIDSTSITLSWLDTVNPGASYSVTYWSNPTDTLTTTATDTTITITGLNSNTVYNFIVVTDCADGNSSDPVTVSYRTDCGTVAVPYTEGFEGLTTMQAPACWTTVGGTPYVRSSSSNAHSGSQYLDFRGAQPNAIVLPPMNQPTGTLQVRFWTRPESYTSSSCGSFAVGYMTDINNASTWVELASWPYNSFSAYTEKEVPMVGAPDSARIVLRHNSGSTNWYWYVDDLVVEPIPSCSHPASVSVTNTTPYTADISVAGIGTDFRIWWSNGTVTDSADISGTTYTISGLSANTNYTVQAATICSDGSLTSTVSTTFATDLTCAQLTSVAMGDISYTAAVLTWNYNSGVGFPSTEVIITLTDNSDSSVPPVTVSTTGTSYTFTGLEAGHSYTAVLRNICDVSGSNDTAANNTIDFMTTSCSEIESDNTTNQYIPTYTYYNYSYTQTIYTASQMPAIDSIHGIAFNITSATVTGNVRNLDVYIGHTTASTFASGTSWLPVSGLTRVAHNVPLDASTTGWKVITFDTVFFYDNDSNLVIAIDDNTGSYKTSPYWASISATGQGIQVHGDGTNYDPLSPASGTVRNSIPAIRFVAACDVPTCFAPMVVVDSIGENAVSVHWSALGIENSWQVGIKVDGAANYTYASGAVTDTFYTFTGLSSNTEYSIVVGSLCTDTLNTVVSVHTNCGITSVPYSTGFEGLSTGDLPNCWTAVQTGSSGSGTFPSAYVYSNARTGSVYFEFESNSGQTEVAALPVMDSISSLMLTFYASLMNHNFTLEAGVMEGNTFVPVDTISNLIVGNSNNWHGSYHEYDVVFSNYTGTGNRLALRVSASGSYTLMLDDISVSYNTGCQRPATAVVDSVSGSDVYLHWTSTSAVTYEVGYATVNDVTDSSLQTVIVSDTATAILGLDPMTQYWFWVRAVCGTATSSWRDAGSASTGCDTVTCDVTIQMFDSFGDGWNGNAIYVYQAGLQIGNATISSGSSGTANISVCSSAPVEFRYHSGSFASEASVTILDGGGATLVNNANLGSYSEGAILATSTTPCPSCITPSNLVATSVTETGIVVGWTDPASTQWEVWFDGAFVANVTTPSYTFTGLTSSTAYTISVRAICAVGDTSAFATANIRTTCGEITSFPWVEGFETAGVLDCWDQEGPSSWTIGTGDYSSSTGAHSGTSNAMILHSSRGNVTKLISPVLALSTGAPATLSFWHIQRSWAGDQDSLVVYYRTSMTDTWHRLMGFQSEVASWTKDSVDLPNTTSTYQICFEMYDGYGYGVAIDDITVEGSSGGCAAPVVGNIVPDIESVTVTFSASGTVEVAIAQGNAANPPATTATATGNSHTFTGLMPSTLYTIFLRQHCTDSTESDWTSVTATTLDLGCVPPTGFNIMGTGYTSVTLGWTQGNDETAWQIEVFNLTFDSIYTVTTNPVVISGLIPAVTYNLRIRSLCGMNSDLPGEWGTDTLTFTTDICPDVEGLTVSNLTAHSADVSWNPTTGVSGYSVLWFLEDVEEGNVTVQNPTYRLDGLEAESPYRVLVKNICAPGASSEHWATVEFTTPAATEGISDLRTPTSALRIFPNPANTTVTLNLEGFEGEVLVEVVDMNGKCISELRTPNSELQIDLRQFAQGAYFIRVTGENTTAIGRLIVR